MEKDAHFQTTMLKANKHQATLMPTLSNHSKCPGGPDHTLVQLGMHNKQNVFFSKMLGGII